MALRTITWCIKDISMQHLHNETKILPLQYHHALPASQINQQASLPSINKINSLDMKNKPLLIKTAVVH